MVETKETMVEMMKSNIVKVTFETKSGKESIKYATLIESILPPRPVVLEEDKNDSLKKVRKVNEKQVSFWSVEDNGWRSFIIDNLKHSEILSGDQVQNLLEEQTKNASSHQQN